LLQKARLGAEDAMKWQLADVGSVL